MTERKKVKISQFLQERTGRFDPNDEAIKSLRRLEKIDFSGEIHLSDKDSKTDMIIIQPGDLVISGINVSKGAIAVFRGRDPITSTIHYSSYLFNEEQIDIEYFKRFVKSQVFVEALKNQVKGGIKTEIKPKDFLPLEIPLPDIEAQKDVVSFFNSIENEMDVLGSEIKNQNQILTNLRQAILQEAIEGKLTAKWRLEHPDLISGGNHASKLLQKIKDEKDCLIQEGKIKKDKPLAPIADEEKPFDLPEGWEWCRLGEIAKQVVDCPHATPTYLNYGKICLRASNITPKGLRFDEKRFVSPEEYLTRIERLRPEKYDLVYIREGGRLGVAGLIDTDEPCCLGQRLMLLRFLDKDSAIFSAYCVNSPLIYEEALKISSGSASPHINVRDVVANVFPLPPLVEQNIIVIRVERLMSMIDELERQVTERQEFSEKLMQAVLKEAFSEE